MLWIQVNAFFQYERNYHALCVPPAVHQGHEPSSRPARGAGLRASLWQSAWSTMSSSTATLPLSLRNIYARLALGTEFVSSSRYMLCYYKHLKNKKDKKGSFSIIL